MRKLLHEVQEIDHYLLRELPTADERVFQARLLTNAALQQKVDDQSAAHRLIRCLGRETRRLELAAIYTALWDADESFRQEISSIFK